MPGGGGFGKQQTRELVSSKEVTQTQQQRCESTTVTLTWHARDCKYKVQKLHQRYTRYPAENTLIELSDSQQRSVLQFCRLQLVGRCVRKGWGTEAEGAECSHPDPENSDRKRFSSFPHNGKGAFELHRFLQMPVTVMQAA